MTDSFKFDAKSISSFSSIACNGEMRKYTNSWEDWEQRYNNMLNGSRLRGRPRQAVYKFLLGGRVCALEGPVTLFVPEHNSGINKPH